MRELLTTGALEKAFTTLKQERSGAVLQKKLIDSLLRDVFDAKQVKTGIDSSAPSTAS
jgi:hypothetical protein